MIKIQESLLRYGLKPRVECDLPGRLRMLFPRYRLLPEELLSRCRYAEEILRLLPGVREVQVNSRIGTILVLYDPSACSSRRILRWVEQVADAGIEMAREPGLSGNTSEQELVSRARQRLEQMLSRCPEENDFVRRRSEEC